MDVRSVIAIALLSMLWIMIVLKVFPHRRKINSQFITRTAIFAAMSIILYLVPYFNLALPIFPGFLKIHFDEVPAFIAGFAYGPLSAFFVIIIKTVAKLPMTITGGVGELADLIYSIAFVIPAAFIYKKHRSIKGVLVAFSIATVIQLLVSCFVTSFAILKFYIFVMGWPESVIVDACHAVNPAVTSLGWTFFFLVALPFNAFKDVMVVIITFLLYKRLHTYIDKLD